MSTLPRHTRAWTSPGLLATASAGTGPLTNKQMTINFVVGLITHAGCVTDYSCDASVAGAKGDGVNRWPTTSQVIGAIPPAAHSWYVLTLPDGLGQLCLDKDSDSDGGGGAFGSLYWSRVVGFTGGTTTARPTASDEKEITSTSGLFSTSVGSGGTYTYSFLRCATAGQHAVRFAVWSAAVSTESPVAVMLIERPSDNPAAFAEDAVARYMGGLSLVEGFAIWNLTVGFRAQVNGTDRTLLAVHETPASALDLDGNRIVVPMRLNNTTVGPLGFLDDWFFVDDAATSFGTFSSSEAVGDWINLRNIVWPWPPRTDPGGGNTALAKALLNFLPAADTTAPAVTPVTPVGVLPGTRAQAAQAAITFDVTDVTPGLALVILDIKQGGGRMEALYRADKGGFVNGYTGSVTAIANGLRFVVAAPAGGWVEPIRITPYPVDGDGNVTP